MRKHELKTVPKYFQATWDRRKRFEFRKNDRGFRAGDTLVLREWDPEQKEYEGYTGRTVNAEVTYILSLNNYFGAKVEEFYDHVIMSIHVQFRLPS